MYLLNKWYLRACDNEEAWLVVRIRPEHYFSGYDGFIDINLLDDGFTIIWALHKCPIGKVLSRMEKELEWESSNVAIKTKLIKHQNQRSGCLLLTLKQKDQAILQNPSTSFMVKSSRNNGGKGLNARLYS